MSRPCLPKKAREGGQHQEMATGDADTQKKRALNTNVTINLHTEPKPWRFGNPGHAVSSCRKGA
jgi:hypothetical protein